MAHEKLCQVEAVIGETGGADLKGISAGATSQAGRFGVEEDDIFEIGVGEKRCIGPLA